MPHDIEKLERVAALNKEFAKASSQNIVDAVCAQKFGKFALVSSFGAESAVLVSMVARASKQTPVILIDTEFLFEETLGYATKLAIDLGLEDVRRIVPDLVRTEIYDKDKKLHLRDADRCCHLRKVLPLQLALGEFAGWLTGRKRYQAKSRENLSYFEYDHVNARIKVNPLIGWSSEQCRDYMIAHDLPFHPLVARGYPSIGCLPCTSQVAVGEDARAGRWRGAEKTECGIHFGTQGLRREKKEDIAL